MDKATDITDLDFAKKGLQNRNFMIYFRKKKEDKGEKHEVSRMWLAREQGN